MLDGNQRFKATHCFQLHYKDTYMNLYCYENLKYHLNMPLKKNTLWNEIELYHCLWKNT